MSSFVFHFCQEFEANVTVFGQALFSAFRIRVYDEPVNLQNKLELEYNFVKEVPVAGRSDTRAEFGPSDYGFNNEFQSRKLTV